jgi:hypothetical protein
VRYLEGVSAILLALAANVAVQAESLGGAAQAWGRCAALEVELRTADLRPTDRFENRDLFFRKGEEACVASIRIAADGWPDLAAAQGIGCGPSAQSLGISLPSREGQESPEDR